MKIELIGKTADCFKGNTGSCLHYPTGWTFLIIIYLIGVLYFYPKTVYLDGYYTPSWESPLCLIWFIWFPLRFIYNKLNSH